MASQQEKGTSAAAESNVKIFNFEKQRRRERPHAGPFFSAFAIIHNAADFGPACPVRRRAAENLLRRAGGLKKCTDLKYDQLVPLYQLWASYFKKVMAHMNNRPDERLLKADYHGALLRVSDALNPTQIGLHGIVLHESKSTFQMITKRNRVIVIPKEGSIFQFVLDSRVFTLFGNALRQRSHLRGKKAKAPTTIPCFLN